MALTDMFFISTMPVHSTNGISTGTAATPAGPLVDSANAGVTSSTSAPTDSAATLKQGVVNSITTNSIGELSTAENEYLSKTAFAQGEIIGENSYQSAEASQVMTAPTLSTPLPTSRPSATPSASPSETPSDILSNLPSHIPSKVSSNEPSMVPSLVPSNEPSQVPSQVPSDLPSEMPSEVPSEMPSQGPSDSPTCPQWVMSYCHP